MVEHRRRSSSEEVLRILAHTRNNLGCCFVRIPARDKCHLMPLNWIIHDLDLDRAGSCPG